MSNLSAWPIGVLWAAEPRALEDGLGLLGRMDFAAHVSAWRDSSADAELRENCYAVEDGVAIISIEGPMTKKPSSMSAYFGGVSTQQAGIAIKKAVADPAVNAILLNIDSPGGHVNGTADLAEIVAAAAKVKPTEAFIDGQCCSAAYWVASQASHLTANATADIGSIGVRYPVIDNSKQMADKGVKVHWIVSGEHKAPGAPGSVVTDAQLAVVQGNVDDVADQFRAAVSAGRGLDAEKTAAVSDGRVFIGARALDAGLIDGIGNYESALNRLKSKNSSGQRPQEAKHVREKLAAALAAIGMSALAGKLIGMSGGDEENAKAIADQIGAEVDAKVKAEIAANPMLAALESAEVKTTAQLADVLAEAKAGREASASIRAEAKKEAVRAFGAEAGSSMSATVDASPLETVKGLSAAWKASADKQFGIGKDGASAKRKSAPSALVSTAADDDDGHASKTAGPVASEIYARINKGASR